MLTDGPARAAGRPVAMLMLFLSLCLLFLTLLSREGANSWTAAPRIETFISRSIERVFAERHTECRRSDGWVRAAVGGATRAILADVPNHPHIAALPLKGQIAVTVSPLLPKVTTDITDIVLLDMAVRDVDMYECRTPLDYLRFMPRILPDSGTIMLIGLNITAELQVDESGMFGIMAHRGRALAKAAGDMSLTLSYTGFNETRVTGCEGHFDTAISWPDDAVGYSGAHVRTSPPPPPPPRPFDAYGEEEEWTVKETVSMTEHHGMHGGDRDTMINLGIPLAKVLCHGLAAVMENPLANVMEISISGTQDKEIPSLNAAGASYHDLLGKIMRDDDHDSQYEFEGLVPMLNTALDSVMPSLRDEFQRQHKEMLRRIALAREFRDSVVKHAADVGPCDQNVRWLLQHGVDFFANVDVGCSPPPHTPPPQPPTPPPVPPTPPPLPHPPAPPSPPPWYDKDGDGIPFW